MDVCMHVDMQIYIDIANEDGVRAVYVIYYIYIRSAFVLFFFVRYKVRVGASVRPGFGNNDFF